jgi:hypothetical protein
MLPPPPALKGSVDGGRVELDQMINDGAHPNPFFYITLEPRVEQKSMSIKYEPSSEPLIARVVVRSALVPHGGAVASKFEDYVTDLAPHKARKSIV